MISKKLRLLLSTHTGPYIHELVTEGVLDLNNVVMKSYALDLHLPTNLYLRRPALHVVDGAIVFDTDVRYVSVNLKEMSRKEHDRWFLKRPRRHYNHGHDPRETVDLLNDPPSGCDGHDYSDFSWWQRLIRPWTWYGYSLFLIMFTHVCH